MTDPTLPVPTPELPHQPKPPDHDDRIHDLHDAARELAEFGERIFYGAVAFGTTAGILIIGFHFEAHQAAEPAMLNAGIAYYTHAATGRVIRAMHTILVPYIEPIIQKVKPPYKPSPISTAIDQAASGYGDNDG